MQQYVTVPRLIQFCFTAGITLFAIGVHWVANPMHPGGNSPTEVQSALHLGTVWAITGSHLAIASLIVAYFHHSRKTDDH